MYLFRKHLHTLYIIVINNAVYNIYPNQRKTSLSVLETLQIEYNVNKVERLQPLESMCNNDF